MPPRNQPQLAASKEQYVMYTALLGLFIAMALSVAIMPERILSLLGVPPSEITDLYLQMTNTNIPPVVVALVCLQVAAHRPREVSLELRVLLNAALFLWALALSFVQMRSTGVLDRGAHRVITLAWTLTMTLCARAVATGFPRAAADAALRSLPGMLRDTLFPATLASLFLAANVWLTLGGFPYLMFFGGLPTLADPDSATAEQVYFKQVVGAGQLLVGLLFALLKRESDAGRRKEQAALALALGLFINHIVLCRSFIQLAILKDVTNHNMCGGLAAFHGAMGGGMVLLMSL